MSKPKIDKVKLNQLLRSGKTQRECAQVFGVTESAISKAKKELNINVVRNLALENANRVVNKNLDCLDQLSKINNYANELLDLCMRWQRGDNQALQILESQVRHVRVNGQDEPVKQFRFRDPREIALRAMAEIRGQLKLQLEIFQCLYDLKAVAEFQEEVLAAIGEASPDVRREIVYRLNQKRALRRTIQFDK